MKNKKKRLHKTSKTKIETPKPVFNCKIIHIYNMI